MTIVANICSARSYSSAGGAIVFHTSRLMQLSIVSLVSTAVEGPEHRWTALTVDRRLKKLRVVYIDTAFYISAIIRAARSATSRDTSGSVESKRLNTT